MIYVYFNYPNPHVTIHQNLDCGYIRPNERPQQRTFRINIETISSLLKMFDNNEIRFSAQAALNDMWLEVDFNNQAFEVATVLYIKEILGRHYKPYLKLAVNFVFTVFEQLSDKTPQRNLILQETLDINPIACNVTSLNFISQLYLFSIPTPIC